MAGRRTPITRTRVRGGSGGPHADASTRRFRRAHARAQWRRAGTFAIAAALGRGLAVTDDLGALDARKKNDLLRAERLSTEQLDLEDQHRAFDQRLEDFDKGLAELRASVEPLRAALAARESELATVNSELAATSVQHHASGIELSQQSARLELLRHHQCRALV